jgi:hypothetical protein
MPLALPLGWYAHRDNSRINADVKPFLTAAALVVLTALLIVAALVVAAPSLKRISRISIEHGDLVIESSPTGRLADPITTTTFIPLPVAVAAATIVAALVVGLVLAIVWVATSLGLKHDR